MATVLVLDLGTTYFKAALFDRDGRLRAVHREAPPIRHPRPEWWELDVDGFGEAIRRVVAAVRADAPAALGEAVAVTFATQTNSFVLLDADGRPLTPIVLWPDERAAGLADEVRSLSSAPDFRAVTGVPELGTQFMAAKLLWLQREQPDVWRRAGRLCLISDYLTLWLTGRHVTEAGAAGLTGAVDIHALRWWPETRARIGLADIGLPAVTRAGTDLGAIRPEAAAGLGLPPVCRFVVGCLDQFAGAIGAGNIEPGGVSETTGTVLATVRCAGAFATSAPPGVFQGPAFDPGVYYQMIFGSTAANLLELFRNQLPDRPAFESLDRLASAVPPGAEGLRLRAEPRPSGIEGLFTGRTDRHTIGHQARAIMEGVAHALAEQLDPLCGPQRPAEVRSCGGAARSDLWLQIKADVLGIPTVAIDCPEPTSLGAAMLAARTLGWGNLGDLARRWIRTKPPHRPRAAGPVATINPSCDRPA